MSASIVPAYIRGTLVTDDLVEFTGRGGSGTFQAPDPEKLLGRLALRDGGQLSDIAAIPFEDIVTYLARLGERLVLEENEYLQEALEHSIQWSDLTEPLVRRSYETLSQLFTAEAVRETADTHIGIPYLDGWVEHALLDGRKSRVRAMGARAIHIIAGNAPVISALSIIRNAITRSDAIIKAPSNDPLTALAIARTMGEMDPDHPVTKHLSVAYWKGGDTTFEEQLYTPAHVEKIVAWGGLASVRHVTRYIQPGTELISLDPKRSATIIGPEAFADEETLRDVAQRAACDIGAYNQNGCVNARVLYVMTGTEDEGIADVTRLGELIYEELLRLPEGISTKPKHADPELRASIDALRSSDWYHVVGGEDDEGAIIVSLIDDAVDFKTRLSGRVANLVPINGIEDATRAMNAYTQTVGIYPESLKTELRDVLPLYGAQRLVSLGYAAAGSLALPQDAIEPVRRLAKWIVDDACDPADMPPLWLADAAPPAHASF